MNLTFDLGRTLFGHPVIARNLENPHISIDGRSGSGKSFFLKNLILQAARQGAVCIVFDYSSDFRGYTPPADISFSIKSVGSPDFTMNPLVSIGRQSCAFRAQQLLMYLDQTFRVGPRAKLTLWQETQAYLDSETDLPTPGRLVNYLKNFSAPTTSLFTGLNCLELLCSAIHSGDSPVDLDLFTPGLTVLDFSELPARSMQHLLIELILTTVWSVRTQDNYSDSPPLILILDEAQNLSWGQDSMAVRILREGRKFNIAGWFSSQWMDKPAAVSALQQAALQAHFHPDSGGVNRVLNTLDAAPKDREACRRLLHGLQVGQFLWQMADGRLLVVQVDA